MKKKQDFDIVRKRAFWLCFGLLLLVCHVYGCSQSPAFNPNAAHWKIVAGEDPLPHFRAIQSISDKSAQTSKEQNISIWAAGFDGVVYRSNDSGQSWQWNRVSGRERLYALFAEDEHTVWVGGWGGVIYQSRNSGNSWKRHETGIQHRITAITRSPDGRLWAIGDNGTVLVKDKSERSFKKYLQLGKSGLRSINFNEKGNGIIVGYGGAAWSTHDKGHNWLVIDQLTHSKQDYYGCHVTETGMWVVGSFGRVLRSDLNAALWQTVDIKTLAYLRHIHFVDEQHGFITGYGTVFRTDDAGKTWSLLPGQFPYQMLASTSQDGSRVWVVGEYGTIYEWNSSSRAWSKPLLGSGDTLFDAARNPRDRTIWIVGSNGSVKSSTDNGKSWKHGYLDPKVNLNAIVFSRQGIGIITGNNGHIWVWTPESNNWTHDLLPEKENIYHVTASQDNSFWVCGRNGLLYKSNQHGKVWRKIKTRFQSDLYSISFIDRNNGWIVGQNGLIMQTRNGGDFFFANYSGTDRDLFHIYTSSTSITVVGEAGVVMENLSGGQGSSWNLEVLPTGACLNNVVITRQGSIFIVGNGVNLWTRKSRSTAWQKIKLPFDGDLEMIELFDDTTLLVAGQNSLIMIYELDDVE